MTDVPGKMRKSKSFAEFRESEPTNEGASAKVSRLVNGHNHYARRCSCGHSLDNESPPLLSSIVFARHVCDTLAKFRKSVLRKYYILLMLYYPLLSNTTPFRD